MPVMSTLRAPALMLAAASLTAAVSLVPSQDILLPSSSSASDPLVWLGANSPYFNGPNVNNISSDVPEGCTVQQAAYVVRHGSRYPDTGAYAQWTTLYEKIQNATFTATGELAFLHDWEPVLKNPSFQIAQESITGYKELHDLGYQLRNRYPDFYTDGNPYLVWSNLYPRVVQSAEMFVRGYLGTFSSTLGSVITINSTGSPEALGNSLSPSDLCPNFDDTSGGDNATTWASVYLPPITERLNSLITGDLNFTTSDVSIFPYLCGFESQITANLSPWCGTFSDDELLQYEYAQDIRYYYGLGPGTVLEQTMFLPFLNSLVDLLSEGPGQQGVYPNGTAFTLPQLIMAFANDGQITELGAALGVWDDQSPLPADEIPEDWRYIASHFVSMRGTVAFEVLNCDASATSAANSTGGTSTSSASSSAGSSSAGSSSAGSSSAGSSSAGSSSAGSSSAGSSSAGSSSAGSSSAGSSSAGSSSAGSSSAGSSSAGSSSGSSSSGSSSSGSSGAYGGAASGSTTSGNSGSASAGSNGAGTASGSGSSSGSSSGSGFPSWNTTHWNSTVEPHHPHHHHNGSGYLHQRDTVYNGTSNSTSTNQTYIRLRLNDAVYPVVACHDGPGSSCLLSTYKQLIADKYAKSGSFYENCNVTNPASPKEVLGASFFTNLTLSWLGEVTP